MVIVGILVGAFIALFAYCACVVSSGCSRWEEEYLYKGGLDLMNKNNEKVYAVLDEGVWNGSSTLNIIGCSSSPKIAESIFAEHIKKVKDDIDFYNLDAIEDTDDLDAEGGYIYEETENYFSLYLSGEYDTNHIYVKVEEVSLTNGLEGEFVK